MALRRVFVALSVIAAGLFVAARPASAATCSVPSAGYPTINSATADPACTTIKLGKGPFFENVTVPNPGTKIVGKGGDCADKPQTIIDASPGGTAATATHVQADDVTISGIVIRHGRSGIDVEGNNFSANGLCVFGQREADNEASGITVDGDNASIKGSEFHSMDGAAIRLDSGNVASIIGNHAHNLGWNCIMTRVEDTTIKNNRLETCDDHGIKTENDPTGIIVKGNTLDSVDRGIEIRSEGAQVTANKITNAQSYGIQIENSDNSIVEGNTIIGSREDCIELLESGGSDVIGNVARECVDANAGIQVRGESDYLVEDNVVSTVKERCLYAEDTDDVIVRNNVGRQCGGLDADGADPVIEKNRFSKVWERQGVRVSCDTDCSAARIVGNHVSSMTRDHHGFEISGDNVAASGALVADNVSTASGGDGFRLRDLDGWAIENNKAIRSGAREGSNERSGFSFDNVFNLTVSGNSASGGRDDGFHIGGDSDDNTFTGNKSLENVKDGFHIDSTDAHDNVMTSNKALDNAGEGIENDGTDTDLVDNVAKRNRTDCVGNDGSEDLVSGNTCADGSDFTTPPPNGTVD